MAEILKIKKRDGRIVDFEPKKITQAIYKALTAVDEGGKRKAEEISKKVVDLLKKRFKKGEIPQVEQVQDIVEEVLILEDLAKTAKAYILYREKRRQIREAVGTLDESIEMVDQYVGELDWQVKENANMAYSLQGLNHYVVSAIAKKYWLNKIYPKEIREAAESGDFHLHNLDALSVYCAGWDLYDLLLKGFGGVAGKVETKPAKHLRSALGQIVNFIYTIQGEIAGAVAFSFDPQTPIIIKRNGKIENITLEMLFNDYKHLSKNLKKSEVIFTENLLYRRHSIDEADKRKYLDSRFPTEPILFQKDKIEVLTEKGFLLLKAISRHRIKTSHDKLLIIETEDGNILRVSRSHPMILADGSLKKAEKIKKGEFLMSVEPNFNIEEEIEIQNDFAYLIGFMIAEGCWGHQTRDYSIVSQKKHTKERKKIKDILNKLKIPYFEQGEFNVVFGTTRMGRFIRNHLKLQEKSYRKNLPSFIFNLKRESIGAIISGLVDGDGDIDRNKTVRINSTSYTLVMQLKQLLEILGINSTIRYISLKNRDNKENYNWKDIYVIKFKIDSKFLPLFKQSIKIRNIKFKKGSSPSFGCKVIKIIEAKENSDFIYDITTANEHFLINNIVVHNSNFDTLLAPFIYYDKLNYDQVKQALQEFMFNMSVPTRTGFQSPFSNLTLDLKPSSVFAKQPVIIAGQPQDKTYEEFQPEMDMFNRAFYEVMLEGDKNQRVFSVDGDCLCPIKNSEKIKLVKIGEYIDRIMKEQKPAFIKENNCQLVDVRDSNIKCLGLKNGRLNWQKVNFLIRHPLDNLLKIWTTGGFNIKVTPSHSVLALKDGKIESFEASKLKVGDRLISPKIIPLGKNKISEISLAEEFIKKRKEQGIYISNTLKKGKPYQEKRTAIHKRNYGKRTYKYFYGVSVFPLKNIKKDLNKFNFSRAKINLAGSSLKINNSLPITNELIEFLGWYCAEGSAEKNKKCGGISLGFNLIKEKHLPYHIGDLIKKIWPNVQFTFRKIKKRNLTEIRIHSKLLRRIVTEIFEIGNKVGKKVPQIIFEIPPEKKKIFLKAYFAGDAWLTKNIVVNSISRELIYGVSTLLKQLDIFHTITEYYWKGRARWRIIIWRNRKLKPKSSYTISKIPIKESGIERISEKILEKESYYYDSLGRKRRNTIARIFKKFTNSSANFFSTSLQNVKNIIHYAEKLKIEIPPVLKEIEKGELLFFKIKKIEKAFSSNRMAYDFSTGSENFVADQFLVHNTFPIPTINITKDFNWDNPALEPMWQATAKYGVNYFSNYINSDMKPEDVKSMCCRLRLDLTELHNRGGGGLFGSGSLTGCYDEKTEILTEDSWKSFKDLTKEDRVFTLDDNNKIELHKPKRLFEYDYQGKMVHFKGRSFDLLVTPNHKMVVDHKGSMKRMFVEAKDFKPYQHYIPKEGTWGGEEREHFVLPPVLIMGGAGPESRFSERQLGTIRQLRKEGNSIYQLAEDFNCNSVTVHNICTKESYGNRGRLRLRYEAPPLKIKMDDWLKFFGFWTAEGCTDNDKIALDHGYRVVISQVNKQKREEIRKVLDSLPFNYYLGGENNFVICNKQLWSYLRQFGNKYEKFIPKEIRSLSKRQLKILFDWLVKGDGHIRKTTGQINYWTASKKLADDLQEIILKLGWLGTLARQKSKVSQIKGRKVKSGIIYTLGAQKTKHYGFGKKEKIKERIREVNYKGKIYCCEVENHTVFVRRNGKVTWSGNSIGVVTIDLPRIGYLSKTKKEFLERLAKSMDLAKESLEIKRKTIENFIEKGLYPYSKFYLSEIKKARGAYYANHFSTIGLLGMNEALLNFLGENIASLKGQKFTLEVLDFMRERLVKYQEETGNLYNLEQTPAESTSFRLALKDKEKYPEIITAGTKETPFYTNSSQLPVNYTDDVFEALKLQDEITCKYTGGSVFHIFLGEKISDIQSVKNLVKKVFENFHLPYITITPTFSICPSHGYLSGEHFFCPKCVIKQPCEVYSRIVGYIRLVSQWNVGKQQEFKERKTFKFSKSET